MIDEEQDGGANMQKRLHDSNWRFMQLVDLQAMISVLTRAKTTAEGKRTELDSLLPSRAAACMAYLDWLSVLLLSMAVCWGGTVPGSEKMRNFTVNRPEGFLFDCSSFVERHVSDASRNRGAPGERSISLNRVQGLSSTVWVSDRCELQAAN